MAIMFIMFVALLKNIAGPDILMLGSLAMMLAADAVDIPEGLKGFSNKGLLTVACLFVVAAGISNTGALDYYMGKLLGTPKSPASAQIRLMVPVAIVSAFLNNTPVVAIMIPILQKWYARKNRAFAKSDSTVTRPLRPASPRVPSARTHPRPPVSSRTHSRASAVSTQVSQVRHPGRSLMIPLSFASILGGTCTLIGTSTNLVVEGMMRERYPDAQPMGLFALSLYGVPVAMSGMAYILIASPFLLPGGRGRRDAASGADDEDDLIEDSLAVGAVVAPKSPVIDQPVATLRGLNGLYLVSVQRGDMLLRAVTPEFLLEEGDVLHFTGLVSSIGEVCVEHGLLPLTHETEVALAGSGGDGGDGGGVAPDAVVVSPDGVSEYERDDARERSNPRTRILPEDPAERRDARVSTRGAIWARARRRSRVLAITRRSFTRFRWTRI